MEHEANENEKSTVNQADRDIVIHHSAKGYIALVVVDIIIGLLNLIS